MITPLRVVACAALAGIMLTVGLLIGATRSVNALGFAVLIVGMLLIGEGYFLIWRTQVIHSQGEQLLGAGARLLALVPGKSAERTDGSDDEPGEYWQALRETAEEQDEDFMPDPAPTTQPIVMPDPGPETQPDMKAAHTVEPTRTLEQILAEYREAREGAK